jgi:hypothetical protein
MNGSLEKLHIFTPYVFPIRIRSVSMSPVLTILFYQALRAPLTSNATFTHLMVKLGAHGWEDPHQTRFVNKAAADAFETIIAAIHKERGMQVLREWLKAAYWPLLRAAKEEYTSLYVDRLCFDFRSAVAYRGREVVTVV